MPNYNYPPETSPEFTTPPPENFNTETMRGSIQEILADNIGVYVICEFLLGTGPALTRKQGTIHSAGRSYFVLYDDQNGRYEMCDIFSVKFVSFYPPGRRPVPSRPMPR